MWTCGYFNLFCVTLRSGAAPRTAPHTTDRPEWPRGNKQELWTNTTLGVFRAEVLTLLHPDDRDYNFHIYYLSHQISTKIIHHLENVPSDYKLIFLELSSSSDLTAADFYMLVKWQRRMKTQILFLLQTTNAVIVKVRMDVISASRLIPNSFLLVFYYRLLVYQSKSTTNKHFESI